MSNRALVVAFLVALTFFVLTVGGMWAYALTLGTISFGSSVIQQAATETPTCGSSACASMSAEFGASYAVNHKIAIAYFLFPKVVGIPSYTAQLVIAATLLIGAYTHHAVSSRRR